MHHTHFNIIHSTQIYLLDNLVELQRHGNEILISASEQTLGIGRRGAQWDSYENSIAMSFTIRPNPTPTLTPIEIGILTCMFLIKEYGVPISLKWPNDLLTPKGLKCGGIIAQYINSEAVIAGLGLNIGKLECSEAPEHYKHGLGNISNLLNIKEEEKKIIPAKLYSFILENRINDHREVQASFNKFCFHINTLVTIEDDGIDYSGKFIDIGKNGEAYVEIEGTPRAFLSGSLKILS